MFEYRSSYRSTAVGLVCLGAAVFLGYVWQDGQGSLSLLMGMVGFLLMAVGVLLIPLSRDEIGFFTSLGSFVLVLFTTAVLLEMVAWGTLGLTGSPHTRRVVQNHLFRGPGQGLQRKPRPVTKNPKMAPFFALYGWRILPQALREKADWTLRGFRLNSLDEQVAHDSSADFRVFITGGSSVMGPGLQPEQTISAHLERMLSKRWDMRVNVVNAGLPAWASANEMALLFHELFSFYKPDMIIVLDGYNDSLHAIKAGSLFRNVPDPRPTQPKNYLYNPRLRRHHRQWNLWMTDPPFVLNQWLKVSGWNVVFQSRRYFTATLLQSVLEERRGGSGKDVDDVDEFDPADRRCRRVALRVEPYLRNVRSMLGGAAVHEIPIVYALQPAFVYKRSKTPDEVKFLEKVRRAVYKGENLTLPTTRSSLKYFGAPPRTCFGKLQRRFFRRAREGFDQLELRFDSQNIAVRDLSRLFSEREGKLFVDWVHYSEKGNRNIARRLASIASTLRTAQETQ